ncbi:MAG: hypothetical protein F4Y88_07890 [Chloroflexi bacterium]|nr:hypothetical protein [Chloroflexota bacterium]
MLISSFVSGRAVRRLTANSIGWGRSVETRVVSPILKADTLPSPDVAVLIGAFRRVMTFDAARIVWVASKMAKAWASAHWRSG